MLITQPLPPSISLSRSLSPVFARFSLSVFSPSLSELDWSSASSLWNHLPAAAAVVVGVCMGGGGGSHQLLHPAHANVQLQQHIKYNPNFKSSLVFFSLVDAALLHHTHPAGTV